MLASHLTDAEADLLADALDQITLTDVGGALPPPVSGPVVTLRR